MENVHFIISFHYELFELFVRICNNFANNINYFRLVESLKWLVNGNYRSFFFNCIAQHYYSYNYYIKYRYLIKTMKFYLKFRWYIVFN